MPTDTMTRSSLLERAIATLDVFPLSQATVIKNVMTMTASMDTAVDDLAKALSVDQALTGKVIRLSNSPFYGRVRTVSTLGEAITILGFQTIRSLVVATSTSSMFRKGADKELEQKLWRHSLAVAIAARMVAREQTRSLAEEAFLIGLVHDIAQLVLLQRFPKEYKPVIEEARTRSMELHECEQEMLGFTHMQLGAEVLEHWSFPSHLKDVLRCHHQPDTIESGSDDAETTAKASTLAHVTRFADDLAVIHDFCIGGMPGRSLEELASSPSAEVLGMDNQDLEAFSKTFLDHFAEIERSFEG